jgi:hypothetical protein
LSGENVPRGANRRLMTSDRGGMQFNFCTIPGLRSYRVSEWHANLACKICRWNWTGFACLENDSHGVARSLLVTDNFYRQRFTLVLTRIQINCK